MLTGSEREHVIELLRGEWASRRPDHRSGLAPGLAQAELPADPERAAAHIVDHLVIGEPATLSALLAELPSPKASALREKLALRTGPFVLEDVPYPWATEAGQELFERLRSAAQTEKDAEALVDAVEGLDWQRVKRGPDLYSTWRSILDVAAVGGRVRQLVDRALATQAYAGIHPHLRRLLLVRTTRVIPQPGWLERILRYLRERRRLLIGIVAVAVAVLCAAVLVRLLPPAPQAKREHLTVVLLDAPGGAPRVQLARTLSALLLHKPRAVLLDMMFTAGPSAEGTAELRAAVAALRGAGVTVHALLPPDGAAASDLPRCPGQSDCFDTLMDGKRPALETSPIAWPACRDVGGETFRTLGFGAAELLRGSWKATGAVACLADPVPLRPIPADRTQWPFDVIVASVLIGGPSATTAACGLTLPTEGVQLKDDVVIVGNGMDQDDSVRVPVEDAAPACLAGAEIHAWVAASDPRTP